MVEVEGYGKKSGPKKCDRPKRSGGDMGPVMPDETPEDSERKPCRKCRILE
jgi:hypothetical protein